jgi:transposase
VTRKTLLCAEPEKIREFFAGLGPFQAVVEATASPGQRESAGKSKELGISKEGSRLLRWALVEAAWRLVRLSRRWGTVFEGLRKRRGKKKAIVAVARRLLGVMTAMLRAGQPYRQIA